MRVAMFYHSILSDWNHGNAHFLRGIASELLARNHEVVVYEPRDGWSAANLVKEHGPESLDVLSPTYPRFYVVRYDLPALDVSTALRDVDLVLVHEWNDPELVIRIGAHRKCHDHYCLLFHDTHHRAVSELHKITEFDLRSYDGVLAYGASLREIYLKNGLAENVWVWHEAADTRVFHSKFENGRHQPTDFFDGDVVWIGNWGDDERVAELHEFFIEPVVQLGLKARVYGVRYPACAIAALQNAGIEYAGWLPNFRVPDVFNRFRATVHIPRRPYVAQLPGIPTIRPFEALACGIPLICAPWNDVEGLFSPGRDYLIANNSAEMIDHLRRVLGDPEFAAQLSRNGLQTIARSHTCVHRVDQLLSIYSRTHVAAFGVSP